MYCHQCKKRPWERSTKYFKDNEVQMDNECTHRRSWGRSIMRFKGNEAIPVNFPVKAEPKQRVHRVKPAVKRIEIREDTSWGSSPPFGIHPSLASAEVRFKLKFPPFYSLRFVVFRTNSSALLHRCYMEQRPFLGTGA